jgi:hypothetical protein
MRNNLVSNDECCRPCDDRPQQECCDGIEGPRGLYDQKMPSKARSITIEQMDFGYIVRVGCQTFAIESASKVVTNLIEYLQDPGKVEMEWNKTRTLK